MSTTPPAVPQTTPPAPQTPAAPAEKAGPHWTTVQSASGAESGGFVDTMKSYWRNINQVLDTPALGTGMPEFLFNRPKTGPDNSADASLESIIHGEVNTGNPYRAALAEGLLRSVEDAHQFAQTLSSPKQALLYLSKSKAVGEAANLYFAWRGSHALQDSQKNSLFLNNMLHFVQGKWELINPNEFQSQLMSVAQIAGSAGGVGAGGKDALHETIRDNMGLTGDLAAKVEAKVNEAAKIEAATKAEVSSTQQIGEGIQRSIIGETQTSGELTRSVGQVMADAAQAVQAEQSRLNLVSDGLAQKATTPLSSVADMRAMVINTLQAHGLQDGEISKLDRIFNALPDKPQTTKIPTGDMQKASINAANMAKGGMSPQDIRGALVNMGYVPAQVDTVMAVAGIPQSTTVDWKMAQRVENDLWDAASAATDPNIRKGLFQAHDNVARMRKDYADTNGFGPEFQSWKNQYSKFKNDLGGGVMSDFIGASDTQDRAILPRLSKIIFDDPTQLGQAGKTAELRDLLKTAGVDITPVNNLLRELKRVSSGTEQTVSDIQNQAQDRITELGISNALIKGKSDLQLEGRTTGQIQQEIVQSMMNSSRSSGIGNPFAYIQIMMGLARITLGSFGGSFQLASGTSRIAVQKLLSDPEFQNWIIQESGVEKPQIPVVRKAIESSYTTLRDLAKKGILANTGIPNQTDNVLATQPPAPPRPATPSPKLVAPTTLGPIRIGQ